MSDELFFWLGPAQYMVVLVPKLKYPTRATIAQSETVAAVTKPLYKAVVLNE